MEMGHLETRHGRSTIHPQTVLSGLRTVHRPDLKHAMVVVNRALRSAEHRDGVLHDRIQRAACVLHAATATETAFQAGRPVDVALRIAARVVRRLL